MATEGKPLGPMSGIYKVGLSSVSSVKERSYLPHEDGPLVVEWCFREDFNV